jgi:hypothetical protein
MSPNVGVSLTLGTFRASKASVPRSSIPASLETCDLLIPDSPIACTRSSDPAGRHAADPGDNTGSPELLIKPNPTFERARLAERIPSAFISTRYLGVY